MMTLILFLALINAPPEGKPLSGPELDRRTHEVASLLRCPVCQGMPVADSPSTMALDMKRQVRDMLAKGYSQEQILAYFETSYGQFVLLAPKSRVIWAFPVVLLIAGAIVVVIAARRLTARSIVRREPSTDPYIARVRELMERR